jgi:hypothetical protein
MQGSLYSKSQLGNHNQNLKFIKDTVETLEIHMDPERPFGQKDPRILKRVEYIFS